MKMLRVIAGCAGALLCFVSLINLWMTWLDNADTTFHWTLSVIGALLWLQMVPIQMADERAERKQRILEMLRKK